MLQSDRQTPATGKVEGLANTSFARTTKDLNRLMRNLRAEGAQSDLNLPRVVVIGNQSAGKSSLVEAISKIMVPRDAGTCTRCPMELRLSSSDHAWTCQVSIRWEDAPRGGGVRSHPERPFGDAFTKWEDVELMLRRAQAAVLNPSIDSTSFLSKGKDEVSALLEKAPRKFSKNVVCLDLSGPDLPDLSFVDLPGLIQNGDKGEVEMVERLVRSYIKDSNTLILVASPMTDDMQNQKAAQLAREVDPEGMRTIGALTKPDAIPAGATGTYNTYLNIIAGTIHRTKHGYYVVRQPDDAERERNISHEEARAAETRFFLEKAPWATSPYHHRFGVENLIKCVSDRLTELIRADLPRIEKEVVIQRGDCMRRIRALPPKTAEPYSHVLRITGLFAEEVKHIIQGSPDHTTLVQDNKRSYDRLFNAILGTAPPFLPYRIQQWQWIPWSVREDSRTETLRLDDIIWLDTVRSKIQACITRELPNNVPYSVKCSFIRNFQQDWSAHVDSCFEEVEGSLRRALTGCVEKHFGRFRVLKGAVVAAVSKLVNAHAEVARQQQKYMLQYELNPPRTQNTDGLAKLRAEWLAAYRSSREKLTSVPNAPEDQSLAAALAPPSNPQTPQTPLFVFNDQKSKGVGEKAYRLTVPLPATAKAKMESLTAAPVDAPFESSQQQGALKASVPSANPITENGPSASAPLPTPSVQDTYEEEMAFIAEIRAYFEVSSKRLADNIPAAIDQHLLYAFSEVLLETLIEKLGLASEDAAARCAKYLAEEPDVAAMREELQAKKRRLDQVHKELCEFGL
ncbi:P-loop containing nucleoside triphosphate hydrolase protein [Trametes coccinea BRFM310]|uniref:p-loop containing nucleoside triphosphate hydrolase protein n=1 Tax=Trametes coccinea (strain BRFM310) TaxID=1353009 RepID=A0A1Y2IHZ3_TRAC3|nr:P-loop containing nucleoside triphosphate hydrolase protein [Trametes coccinea BRFM310]